MRARITGFPKINGSGSPRNLTQSDRAGAHGNYRVGVESRALVETPCGHRTIGELQESDQVMTLDHGFQKILWINKFFFAKSKAVLIKKKTFGNVSNIYVCPQQCLFLSGELISILFGAKSALCPSYSLINNKNIFFVTIYDLTFVQVLFPQHEVLFIDSIGYESFFINDDEMSGISSNSIKRIECVLPKIKNNFRAYGSTARMRLTYEEGRVLHEYLQRDELPNIMI